MMVNERLTFEQFYLFSRMTETLSGSSPGHVYGLLILRGGTLCLHPSTSFPTPNMCGISSAGAGGKSRQKQKSPTSQRCN